ncbi:hypothetical protein DIZ76_010953 [Coccidioides immitis]|uniref:Ornithine transporter 2 n=1 Tax=Coccidioides immitis RMSCC 2394 TaxID=404692 RepID=A0A0J6Y4Z9_COCIT|nr:ornithine transporter 2 [Coccidioides immitis RMSCC 2394]TPX25498.1 hypothetical protein DIZ76_010953 [Coccidioides immitis]
MINQLARSQKRVVGAPLTFLGPPVCPAKAESLPASTEHEDFVGNDTNSAALGSLDGQSSPMSADFWAGYLSGAIGIIIGNPLDIIKVRLQASHTTPANAITPPNPIRGQFEGTSSLVRGAAAPILGYGALNALLFVAYNRTLMYLSPTTTDPTNPQGVPLSQIWLAGAIGGLASWTISSPTELVKCRAQLSSHQSVSSWAVAKDILRKSGPKGLYFGGLVTSIRDSVGYGFYFWSYELCKRLMDSGGPSSQQEAISILLCGGIAGVVTWASVFPLDVIKTRLQAQSLPGARLGSILPDRHLLLASASHSQTPTTGRILNSVEITRQAYRSEGLSIFYRGLGVCSIRAFIVNAVQWATYEWIMKAFEQSRDLPQILEKI